MPVSTDEELMITVSVEAMAGQPQPLDVSLDVQPPLVEVQLDVHLDVEPQPPEVQPHVAGAQAEAGAQAIQTATTTSMCWALSVHVWQCFEWVIAIVLSIAVGAVLVAVAIPVVLSAAAQLLCLGLCCDDRQQQQIPR